VDSPLIEFVSKQAGLLGRPHYITIEQGEGGVRGHARLNSIQSYENVLLM